MAINALDFSTIRAGPMYERQQAVTGNTLDHSAIDVALRHLSDANRPLGTYVEAHTCQTAFHQP